MSGHKRATISLTAEDYQRLEAAAERLRQVEKDYQDIHLKVNELQRLDRQAAFQETADRQAQLQAALLSVDSGFQTELADLEAHCDAALLSQVDVLHSQMDGLESTLWEHTQALLDTQTEQMFALERASQSAQLELFQRMEQRARFQQAGKASLAEQAIHSGIALLSGIEQAYALNDVQEEIQAEAQALELAGANLSSGLYEAALLGSQQAYLRLSALRRSLERRLVRQRALRSAALAGLQRVYQVALRLRQVRALDLEGNELDTALDVNWWSGGQLEALIRRCQGLISQVEGSDLDEDELASIIADRLPALEHELDEIVYQSRRAVLASQMRYNLARCVVRALQEQGFVVHSGGYADQDMRCGYQAALRHLDGGEVVVSVTPLPGEIGISQLDLYSQDRAVRTDHELRQRAREMARSLRAQGLEIGRNDGRSETVVHSTARAEPWRGSPQPARLGAGRHAFPLNGGD